MLSSLLPETFNFIQLHPLLVGVSAFLAIPLAFAMVDFAEVIHGWFHKKPVKPVKPTEDFVILVPIFNHMRYFKNAEYLKEYREKVIICTTTHENEEFYADLQAMCDRYGFRQHRSDMTFRGRGAFTRNPWKIFHTILEDIQKPAGDETIPAMEGREALLIESSVFTSAKYCLFLDGDTTCVDDLRNVVGEFKSHDYDLASVRVVPSNRTKLVEQMQNIEYQIAMDARKLYPWLTSGACMIAKTSVLHQALSHHSHFFQGGDIEIGKLARILGYKVGHIDTTFLTVVPSTFRAWFGQRVAWSSGDFRHAIVNIHMYSWRHPLFFLYFTVVVYGLMPIRIWLTITDPLILPWIIAIYWVLLFVMQARYRARNFLVFPFYAMVQCLIITPLGILYYLQTVYRHRNIGIIRLRHEPELKRMELASAKD